MVTKDPTIPTHAKLTKRAVDTVSAGRERYIVWDTNEKGFGLRVEPSGTKTFIVRYRANNRKRLVTIGRYGSLTPETARKRAKEILANVARGSDPATDKARERTAINVSQLVEKFLSDHVEAKRKAATSVHYKGLLHAYFVPRFVNRKAADLSRGELANLHLQLREKPYQANRLMAVVAAMYVWAGKHGHMTEGINPARGIERFPEARRERFLTRQELGRLGDAIRELEAEGRLAPSAATAVRLLLLTGARLREILNLRWEHLDSERRLLLLSESKTGAKAIVLNAPAFSILENIPRTGEYIIAGDRANAPRADIKKPWQSILARAGFTGLRLHDLRHTFASHGAAASLGLPIVGKLLGHTQAATTQRYAHLDSDPLRRASDQIGATINTAMENH